MINGLAQGISGHDVRGILKALHGRRAKEAAACNRMRPVRDGRLRSVKRTSFSGMHPEVSPWTPGVFKWSRPRGLERWQVEEAMRMARLTDEDRGRIGSEPYHAVHLTSACGNDTMWLERAFYAKRLGRRIHFIEKKGSGCFVPDELVTRGGKCGLILIYGEGKDCKFRTYADAVRFLTDALGGPRPMEGFTAIPLRTNPGR